MIDNNCLIDTLRLVLPFRCIASMSNIRIALRDQFREGEARVSVQPCNFLELDHNANAILRLLTLHNELRSFSVDTSQYRIVCVHLGADGRVHAGVTGSGPQTLYIANEGNLHFRPLMRDRR